MNFGFVPDPFAVWKDAKPLLAPAVEWGKNDWNELVGMLADGRAQLWLVNDDGPIVALVTRQDGDVFEVWLCGGKVLPHCLHFLTVAENAARERGMKSARITGRKGWARVLTPWGWKKSGDDLVKEL